MIGALELNQFDTHRLAELHRIALKSQKLSRPVSVAEVFGNGKFAATAQGMFPEDYEPNIIADLRAGCDFNKAKGQRAIAIQFRERLPGLAIFSPLCKGHSRLRNLSPDSPAKQATYAECLRHLKFVVRLIRQLLRQKQRRTRILLEPSDGGTSWEEKCMLALMAEFTGLVKYIGDQCIVRSACRGAKWYLTRSLRSQAYWLAHQ